MINVLRALDPDLKGLALVLDEKVMSTPLDTQLLCV
jgi:hypothetical protein